jgi:hypothetical protein
VFMFYYQDTADLGFVWNGKLLRWTCIPTPDQSFASSRSYSAAPGCPCAFEPSPSASSALAVEHCRGQVHWLCYANSCLVVAAPWTAKTDSSLAWALAMRFESLFSVRFLVWRVL